MNKCSFLQTQRLHVFLILRAGAFTAFGCGGGAALVQKPAARTQLRPSLASPWAIGSPQRLIVAKGFQSAWRAARSTSSASVRCRHEADPACLSRVTTETIPSKVNPSKLSMESVNSGSR